MAVNVDCIVIEDRIEEIEEEESSQRNHPIEVLIGELLFLVGSVSLPFLRFFGELAATHGANIEPRPSLGN